MMLMFSTSRDLIRTLPALQHDDARPEDVDSDMEDHAPDTCRYACMSRPFVRELAPKPPEDSWDSAFARASQSTVEAGAWHECLRPVAVNSAIASRYRVRCRAEWHTGSIPSSERHRSGPCALPLIRHACGSRQWYRSVVFRIPAQDEAGCRRSCAEQRRLVEAWHSPVVAGARNVRWRRLRDTRTLRSGAGCILGARTLTEAKRHYDPH